MSKTFCLVFVLGVALAQPKLSDAEANARWHDMSTFPIEGKGWTKTKHIYDRLPAMAEGVVRPPVWSLGQDSAGLRVRFVSDSPFLRARWKVRKPRLALPHMPSTGVSGLDLYSLDNGTWRWTGAGRPGETVSTEATIASRLGKRKREYMLYFPLYNALDTVEIGVAADAVLEPAPARYASRKPIVFYGTSILQGGCASRPGMAYPSIVGRALDWPIINLGFSGNGKSEPEMATLLAEIDAAAYVLDSLPNLSVAETGERVEPFFRTLRTAHPNAPVLFVENVRPTNSAVIESQLDKPLGANGLLRKLYQKVVREGDRNVHYITAAELFGGDGEDTVDGVHATDLGFLRMAEGVTPVLRAALSKLPGAPKVDEGFESLFDGKSLAGWRPHTGLPKEHVGGKWWVEDGQILGTQDPPGKGGFLVTTREFGDFILRLQVKMDYPVDSGVFLRVGPDGKSHQVTLDYRPDGDIGDIYLPWTQSMVYRNPEGVRSLRADDWNDVEIRIEGEPSRIRFWLNGRLLTDFQHSEVTTKNVPTRGGIALQVHPDVGKQTLWKENNRVRFRNIRVREIGRSTR